MASSDDATFLKTEINASARSRSADDDVIDQLELNDSDGFENSPGEPQIGFARREVARWVIVHQDEGDGALTNRADLNAVLFGVEKNDPERFASGGVSKSAR